MYIDDVNVGAIVGVDEFEANAFAVFPNPSNGRFTLRAGVMEGDMVVRVYGVDGSLVHQERWVATQGAELNMDMSALSSGSYVVSLSDVSGNNYRSRVVIQ